MTTKTTIENIRTRCETEMGVLDIATLRDVLEVLAKANLMYNPDDSPEDIRWEESLDDEDISRMIWIDNTLLASYEKLGVDPHDEVMSAHVRVFGERSCFYQENA